MARQEYPDGLSVSSVSASLAAAALEEVRQHLVGHGAIGGLATAMFELNWSYLKTTRACAMRRAAPLRDYPKLHELLLEATSAITGDEPNLNEQTLNVICRQYQVGDGLTPHQDLKAMFEEDVYGCVLENTSDSRLKFELGAQSLIVDEQPGTCFRQRGASRFDWFHGIDKLTRGERFSVTWRWVREDSVWYQGDQIEAKPSL